MKNKKRNIFKNLGFILLTLFGAGAVVSGTIFTLEYTTGRSLNKRNEVVKEYNQFITASALSRNELEDERSKSDFDNWVNTRVAETELLNKDEQIIKYKELTKSIFDKATNALNKLIEVFAYETSDPNRFKVEYQNKSKYLDISEKFDLLLKMRYGNDKK